VTLCDSTITIRSDLEHKEYKNAAVSVKSAKAE